MPDLERVEPLDQFRQSCYGDCAEVAEDDPSTVEAAPLKQSNVVAPLRFP